MKIEPKVDRDFLLFLLALGLFLGGHFFRLAYLGQMWADFGFFSIHCASNCLKNLFLALICTLKVLLGMKIEPEVDRDFLLFLLALGLFLGGHFFRLAYLVQMWADFGFFSIHCAHNCLKK